MNNNFKVILKNKILLFNFYNKFYFNKVINLVLW
jgi:hypothetical protein